LLGEENGLEDGLEERLDPVPLGFVEEVLLDAPDPDE